MATVEISSMRHALTAYINAALTEAAYEKLKDGTYFGRIPSCRGVVAFSKNLRNCEEQLQAVLEDWILLGLKMNHRLPVIGGIDLNKKPRRIPLEAV